MSRILVIGGTTKGIGSRVLDMIDCTNNQVFVPGPDVLDIRDMIQIREYLDDHGPFDYTLYCAGVKHLAWIRDINMEDVRDTFEVNLFGFVALVRELVHQPTNGRICVITSDAAITPMRTSLDYCASKSALEMAVKIAAREVPDWQITGIRPSVVSDTEMTDNDIDMIGELRGWSKIEVVQNMRSMIPVDEVASLAFWLLFQSPHSMSGSIVDIRGGM